MKFLVLVMCVVFTKYCCLGVDIDSTDTNIKKQDLSEEAVDAAKTFNNLLMPGPRIFHETSTQTAISTAITIENKKQDQEKISNGVPGPQLTDQNPTQIISNAGTFEEKTKEEESKNTDGLPNSPSSIDRSEKDEIASQNKSVATGTDSMLDDTKNTNINEGGKGAANPVTIIDETAKDELQEEPVMSSDVEKNQSSGTAGPLVTNTQKNTLTGNSTVDISTGFETNEKKADVEKDEENKDAELVELVPSTYTPSKVKDSNGNRVTADGAMAVTGVNSDNQDRKNDEKEDEIVPNSTGNVFGNNQLDSKVTDGGIQSEAISGNDTVVNTGNSVGTIAESSTKYAGLNAEKGIEVEKETGNKDAILDKSEGKTVLETSDGNRKLENKNDDNQVSVGSFDAITTKISSEEEESKVNDKIESDSQGSYYSTTTGTNTGFSDDGMESEDVNMSTSPAETITESPFDDKDDFDDDGWWEDFEDSNDGDNGNDNSDNDISGDYYDDQDGEIEDLDDIAEEDYDYDDDDYDFDDEEGDDGGNNDEGDDKNYSSDKEVPPKDASITGGDLEDAGTWNENENDGPSKNVETDEKYGIDADENDEPIKNVESDDKNRLDIKNDENLENDDDEDDGAYVQNNDKIQENDDDDDDIDDDENHGHINGATTYPTVTEDHYHGGDDDHDVDFEDDEDDMKDTVESGSEDGHKTEGKRPDQKFLEDDRRYKEMTVEFERASSYSWVLFFTIIVITLLFVFYINKSKLQRYFTRSPPKALRVGDEEKNLLEYEYA